MSIRFPFAVSGVAALLGGIIYVLHLYGLVTSANEVYMRFSAWGLFIAGVVLLSWQKARNHRFSWDDIYKNNTLIIVSITLLLISLFLFKRVSYYTIGIFVLASLVHFLYTRKFSVPPNFFYFIFACALLMFLGTIGTPQGFHLPSQTHSFFLLPVAFCCFSLSKKNLLQIGGIFFKTGIIFLIVSLLYWFYNFLYLDAGFIEWITGKTNYGAQMTGWEAQAGTHNLSFGDALTKDSFEYYSAYFFITSWSYLFHPSSNAIVLLGCLITGFYLYYKRDEFPTVSKFDLILYAVPCLLVIMLMQSRIGVVGFLFIAGITGLYYLKLKTRYFKIGLAIFILLGGASLIVLNNKVSGFIDDDVRDSYRRIAISYIQEHIWWGSGFNQQQTVLEQQAEKIKDTLSEKVYPHSNEPITHVHNQFLGNMVQFGVWGLIVLVAMLAAIAYYAVKNRSYLLQVFLCFTFFFMLIEEGEYIKILVFILFFTAISESEKLNKRIIDLRK
jgi:hypothetical protein